MAGKQVKISKELEQRLQEYQRSVTSTAEDIIFHNFPSKILDLQKLIDSTSSSSSPFHLSHASTSTDATVYAAPSSSDEQEVKKRKRTAEGGVASTMNGTSANSTEHAVYPNLVLTNKHVAKVHEIVKTECQDLAEYCDKIKLWVNLNMPKIEDGDNFGVQVQEEVLQELHRSQQSAYNLRDGARQGYLNRAKICSKMIKYPNVEDYPLALKEHDEKQLYCARQDLLDIRNIYAVMTDIIHKNIGKLRSPKGNNSAGLY